MRLRARDTVTRVHGFKFKLKRAYSEIIAPTHTSGRKDDWSLKIRSEGPRFGE